MYAICFPVEYEMTNTWVDTSSAQKRYIPKKQTGVLN